ncbi:MAG: hypothetical protein LBP28_04045, partial [Coriobacteriales bacterium]|nr:hypothetical protein [Coriobacteriales bacterium]
MSDLTIQPTLSEARAAAAGFNALPVWAQLAEDACDPLELFCLLKSLSRHCFMFESLEDPELWGRYTFLGFDPSAAISVRDGELTLSGAASLSLATREPGAYIARMLEDYRSPRFSELPPFTGGLVGYFAYDYIAYSEPSLQLPKQDSEGFKDADLMLFDKVIAYDHLKHRILLIATVRTDALEENYRRAVHELESLAALVAGGTEAGNAEGRGGVGDTEGRFFCVPGETVAFNECLYPGTQKNR